MNMQNTCCFTGHRHLPADRIERIVCNLDHEIRRLISDGVTDFISGGALGFDQIAASLIVAKKEMRENIRLIFALPFKNQDALWGKDKRHSTKTCWQKLIKLFMFLSSMILFA